MKKGAQGMYNINQAIAAGQFRKKNNGLEFRLSYNGKRFSFSGKTQAACKNRARQELEKLEAGIVPGKSTTLNEYMEYWLETFKKPGLEPSSYKRLVSVYQHQIKDGIGKKKIADITTSEIQNLVNAHTYGTNGTKKLARTGLKRLIHALNPCLEHAVDNDVILKNPCKGVVIPTESNVVVKRKEQFSLTDEEIKIFKDVALEQTKSKGMFRCRNRLVLLFMLSTGLRVGEMLSLKWTDIDENNRVINIHSTVQDSVDGIVIKDGSKNGKKDFLPLTDRIILYLKFLRQFDAFHGVKSEYVACTLGGKMQTQANLDYTLKAMARKDKRLPQNITLHTLRHTFGSKLLRSGVPIEEVSKLMRHSGIAITMQKYIHVLNEQKVRAMNMCDVV